MTTNAYAVVAQTIINQLEQGTAPWRKEWVSSGYVPKSLSTKKPYTGINHWLLSFTAMAKEFESPWWGTFKQVKAMGGSVRKGEKGSPVVLYKSIDSKVTEGEIEVERKAVIVTYFTVFNAEQVEWEDGAPAYEKPKARAHAEVILSAQKVVDGYYKREQDLIITYAGDRAFYSPSKDSITVPTPETFTSDEAFYATLFHEMGHSTGHEKRLNREGVIENHYFGSELYSEEELVAEFTSAFLSSETGIAPSTIDNSASYIASWLKALKNEPKMLVKAVARAQSASDYILGKENK
jgi:antirestriction protein ArdC